MRSIVSLDEYLSKKSKLVKRTVFEPAKPWSDIKALYYFITLPLNTPEQADGLVRLVFDSQNLIDGKSYLSKYAESNNLSGLKKLLRGCD